jgi:hypothetical protein
MRGSQSTSGYDYLQEYWMFCNIVGGEIGWPNLIWNLPASLEGEGFAG